MTERDGVLQVIPLFEVPQGQSAPYFLQASIRNTLDNILPKEIRVPARHNSHALSDQRHTFQTLLPLMVANPCSQAPGSMMFSILFKGRPNAFKFFFDMVSGWLVPGKRLNVEMFYATDFRLPDYGDDALTLCEMNVRVEHQEELNELLRNLPVIEMEICLGMQSAYYARRILEIKGLKADAKMVMIQEHIVYLMRRLPQYFDDDLLTEMQHVLVMCHEDFKAARECRHLSRIISVYYLFRKAVREAIQKTPGKRHLRLKLFRTTVRHAAGRKRVVGVIVAINFLFDKEILEEKHLLGAIQNHIPTAHAVKGSFFSHRRVGESICTLYLEVEKFNGEELTDAEINLLRRELPTDLRDRIEHLMHPIFMPRNEEEISRNILSLGSQVNYPHDLPQVIISFDKQTDVDLYFNVIMVSIRQPGGIFIQEKFRQSGTFLEFIPDRSKMISLLRKKYVKEATVFGIKFPKSSYLRRDHSIDLNKARQTVVMELTRVMGDIRDFNGGMIAKQHESLSDLQKLLVGIKYNELLLENFFYALTPDVMRAVLEASVLKTWFMLLLKFVEERNSSELCALAVQRDERYVYAMLKLEDRSQKEAIDHAVGQFDPRPPKMATSFIVANDVPYLGYLYQCDEPQQQEKFYQLLQHCLNNMRMAKG